MSGKLAIGLDIGGTKIAVGVVDSEGRVVARTAFPTESRAGFERGVDRIIAGIREVMRTASCTTASLHGVGIGCPGPVDPFTGTIHNPYTLPGWGGRNVVTPLEERLGVPVRLENDADAAVLGEALAGAAREAGRVVMLTFGTGVGSGVLIDGQVYRGCNHEHPELGHVPVDPAGPACYCGTTGCLESIASGTAIAAAGRALGLEDSRAVFAAGAAGDERAKGILDRVRRATFAGAWTVLHTFLPERLVLGGGLADEHFEFFAVPFREALAAATMVPRDRVQLLRAELGNDAGLVGAASLVMPRRGGKKN